MASGNQNAAWRKDLFGDGYNYGTVTGEPHTVAFDSVRNAYGFYLNEYPETINGIGNDVTIMQDVTGGAEWTEVSIAPSATEFRLDRVWNTAWCEFNAADGAKEFLCDYTAKGGIVKSANFVLDSNSVGFDPSGQQIFRLALRAVFGTSDLTSSIAHSLGDVVDEIRVVAFGGAILEVSASTMRTPYDSADDNIPIRFELNNSVLTCVRGATGTAAEWTGWIDYVSTNNLG